MVAGADNKLPFGNLPRLILAWVCSEIFKQYFGPEHGVELPPPERYGYTPVEFAVESKT